MFVGGSTGNHMRFNQPLHSDWSLALSRPAGSSDATHLLDSRIPGQSLFLHHSNDSASPSLPYGSGTNTQRTSSRIESSDYVNGSRCLDYWGSDQAGDRIKSRPPNRMIPGARAMCLRLQAPLYFRGLSLPWSRSSRSPPLYPFE